MDEKKYEAGRVEISSAEYRDLVTEATENRIAASEARSDKWRAESERDKLKAELEKAQATIADLEQKLDFIFAKNITNSKLTTIGEINNG